MKFFHLSDLHIGKQLNGYSLQENQRAVLSQIAAYAREERPDAVLICGDIYDKSAPSAEAGTILDDFLSALAALDLPVLIISGNHDSGERLRYAARFLENHRIYLGTELPGKEGDHLKCVTLKDELGPVHFYLLPFLKPAYVRALFPEEKNLDYQGAVERLLARETIEWKERNVILSHQFYVSGGERPDTCDSETAVLTLGGLDAVDVKVLDGFDYGALGHIHGGQQVGRPGIRYCGTPFKYSVSEEHHKKSVTVAELGAKGGEVSLRFLPLFGVQDVKSLRGTLEFLKEAGGTARHDLVSLTVTDEEEPFDLREQLEQIYDHILELKVDNARTRARLEETGEEEIPQLGPGEIFGQFYEAVCGRGLNEKEAQVVEEILQELEVEG